MKYIWDLWHLMGFKNCVSNEKNLKSDATLYGVFYEGIFPLSLDVKIKDDLYYITIKFSFDLYRMAREERITDSIPFNPVSEVHKIVNEETLKEIRELINRCMHINR